MPLGTTSDGNSDWSLWWGTFQGAAGARLHMWLWRCSGARPQRGEALVVMTVEDAQRMRLDDHATALAYLSNRFGPGRFRLTPRSEHGTKLPGTQSLIAFIDEDISMHVTMNSAQHRYAFLALMALMALAFNSNIPLVPFTRMAEMIP